LASSCWEGEIFLRGKEERVFRESCKEKFPPVLFRGSGKVPAWTPYKKKSSGGDGRKGVGTHHPARKEERKTRGKEKKRGEAKRRKKKKGLSLSPHPGKKGGGSQRRKVRLHRKGKKGKTLSLFMSSEKRERNKGDDEEKQEASLAVALLHGKGEKKLSVRFIV